MKKEAKILVLDDDEAILSSAKLFLKQKFSFIQTASNPQLLHELLEEIDFDVLLLDMNFSKGENDGKEGLSLIDESLRHSPNLEVIAITAYGEIDLAVEAVRRGARDFITKPWRNEKLLLSIEHLLNLKQHTSSDEKGGNPTVIGNSKPFQEMMALVRKVATTDANVLILGENGAGKEVIAKEIHQLSERSDEALVTVDLGALTASLLESELFGHKKGAFTDAVQDKQGKFQSAQGGTLFLDEIANLPLVQQSKLLSALQNRKVAPVGSNVEEPIDIRLISATNANIEELVSRGEFRQDLLYRINTIEIKVPALRERIEDIPLLVNHYLDFYKQKYQKPSLKIEKGALEELTKYSWPGNIRELAQSVERAVILADFPKLTIQDFKLSHSETSEASLNLREMEKSMILKALEKNRGNITHAAKDLGIDRLALYRRLEKYGL